MGKFSLVTTMGPKGNDAQETAVCQVSKTGSVGEVNYFGAQRVREFHI